MPSSEPDFASMTERQQVAYLLKVRSAEKPARRGGDKENDENAPPTPSDVLKRGDVLQKPKDKRAKAKAPGEGVMVVGGFKQLLHMIVNSGDGGGDGLLGLGDASKPNHAMKADDVKKLRRLFNSVDIDDDQELNASEIVLVFQKWGLDNILESEILELISRFDVDKSGTLEGRRRRADSACLALRSRRASRAVTASA
mmetsp:Transcript_19525/g.67708  ORF Transcript_19525/g.67708 Transcript_19525/m.67708 type:complete len:198 (+) Transcript_19525:160-753(+)